MLKTISHNVVSEPSTRETVRATSFASSLVDVTLRYNRQLVAYQPLNEARSTSFQGPTTFSKFQR